MLWWFSTCVHRCQRAWLAFQLLALISLSSKPSLEILRPRYLNSSAVYSVVPSIEIKGKGAVDPGAGCNNTCVFFRLMVRPYRWGVSTNMSIMSWRSDPLCAIRAQSLANSTSKIILLSVLVFALKCLRLNNDPPSLYLRYTSWPKSLTTWVITHVKKKLNRTGASTQPFFMPLEMIKESENSPLERTTPDMLSWKGRCSWWIFSGTQVLTV